MKLMEISTRLIELRVEFDGSQENGIYRGRAEMLVDARFYTFTSHSALCSPE